MTRRQKAVFVVVVVEIACVIVVLFLLNYLFGELNGKH